MIFDRHVKLPPRYPVLFNPNAKGLRTGRGFKFLMDNATDFVLYATGSTEEAEELAAHLAAQGEPIVVAAGGDGTLNAVVKGLADSTTALGVLPMGTMNVFARELGIPADDLDYALAVIKAENSIVVDLFEANGMPFVQMAGVGVDAAVIEETTWQSKKMLGPLAYLLAAARVLGDNPPTMRIVTAEQQVMEGVAVLAGNGSLYGGSIKLFHRADNQDNMLDVLVFKQAGYKLALDSLRGIAMGAIDFDDSKVSYVQTPSLVVEADREVPLEVDGELAGRSRRVVFGNRHVDGLSVLAPHEARGTRFEEAVKFLMDSMGFG